MSLAISLATPEGLVMTADSRQSYRNRKGVLRVGSDNASKLFRFNSRIGVAITGVGFLVEDGTLRTISKFIDDFKRGCDAESFDCEDLARNITGFFNGKYNWEEQMEALTKKIESDLIGQGCQVSVIKKEENRVVFQFKDPEGNNQKGETHIESINILISGYNKDGSYDVFTCYIPGEIINKRRSSVKGKLYGADWIGQADVISRMILGYDLRIRGLPFVSKAVHEIGVDDLGTQLRGLEYNFQWGTMTLQDGIDFCELMTHTTSVMQRFSDGILLNPGAISSVGGHVDVAVLNSETGFSWVSRKRLCSGNYRFDDDSGPQI